MSTRAAGRIPSLDGVRGLAILLVLLHHGVHFCSVQGGGVLDRWVGEIADELWVGVDLFFVLSGFLITGILLRTRDEPRYFSRFYARRTLRIFPLYYAMVLGMCVVLPRLAHRPYLDDLSAHQAWYWLYAANFRIFAHGNWFNAIFDHTWSLAVEEQFYLVWPLVAYACGARRFARVAVSMMLASTGLRLWMATHGYSDAQIRVLPVSHCEGLALGALLSAGAALRLALPWLVTSGTVLQSSLAGLAWTLAFAGALGVAAHEPERSTISRLLSVRALTVLGTYSYGLYLFHVPVMVWMAPYLARLPLVPQRLAAQAVLLLAAGGLVSLLAAWVSYLAFELRFLRLKARFD